MNELLEEYRIGLSERFDNEPAFVLAMLQVVDALQEMDNSNKASTT